VQQVLWQAVQQQLQGQLIQLLVRELQAVDCLDAAAVAELLQLARSLGRADTLAALDIFGMNVLYSVLTCFGACTCTHAMSREMR
jgi:hypothetical protein